MCIQTSFWIPSITSEVFCVALRCPTMCQQKSPGIFSRRRVPRAPEQIEQTQPIANMNSRIWSRFNGEYIDWLSVPVLKLPEAHNYKSLKETVILKLFNQGSNRSHGDHQHNEGKVDGCLILWFPDSFILLVTRFPKISKIPLRYFEQGHV